MTDSSRSYFYAALTVAFWSTVATAFKLALVDLSVFQLLFVSTLTAAIILLVPIAISGQWQLFVTEFRRHVARSIGTAFLNPLVYYLILFAAYDRLPAQIAQPVNYTWALMLVLLSIVFLKQKPSKYDLIACIVSYSGVVVIATEGQLNMAAMDLVGILLALASTVIWAAYWLLNITDPRNEQVAMCTNFLLAVPMTGLACWWYSDFTLAATGVYAAIYIGIFEMGLAFLLWSKALRLAENTSRVSTMIFISPFVSLMLIQTFLGESIHLTTYIGLSVIIVGLLIQRIPLLRPGFR